MENVGWLLLMAGGFSIAAIAIVSLVKDGQRAMGKPVSTWLAPAVATFLGGFVLLVVEKMLE